MSPSLLVGTTIAVFLFDFRFTLPKLQEQMTGFDERLFKYTGVTNYRCTYCLRQSIKHTILQKPINNVLFNYLFIPSMKTNDISFKIKFNLLKT